MADFFLASKLEDGLGEAAWPDACAPLPVDLFACGVILFEMLALEHPFSDEQSYEGSDLALLRLLSQAWRRWKQPPLGKNARAKPLPPQPMSLIKTLLHLDPAERGTAQKAVSHAWLSAAA